MLLEGRNLVSVLLLRDLPLPHLMQNLLKLGTKRRPRRRSSGDRSSGDKEFRGHHT